MLRKLLASALLLTTAFGQEQAVVNAASGPAITIYNQDFGVVRETIPLDLHTGVNHVTFAGATMRLEPDSVVLRDPSGRHPMQILEQNYRNDPITQESLLSMFEGQTIDFLVQRGDKQEVVKGKVIRGGYFRGVMQQPIIEVDGKLQFYLPGQPIFPALGQNSILKPTLDWAINAPQGGSGTAELSYITGGMSWQAAYNIVAPEKGNAIDLIGWVTMVNQTGTTFENARFKLMAGDVNKLQPQSRAYARDMAMKASMEVNAAVPVVTEKAFDEYHLYTLANPTTLRDQETKQVEFVRGTGVKSQRIYVYQGMGDEFYYYGGLNQDPSYGTTGANKKVWVMQEFKNSKENGLGIPLPKGRVRFYRRDDDGQLEFTGENMIDHTPTDELVRLYTGNSFDIVGDRKRTDFKIDTHGHWMDETFEVRVRNHKKEQAEVRIVEKLYRWTNWQITAKSTNYKKSDAQTIEFPVQVAANGEAVVTYTVHYSW